MIGPIVSLVALSLAVAWAVVNRAGVYPSDWFATLFGVGAVSTIYWIHTRRVDRAPRLTPWLRIAIWAFPAYVLFQLIPFPLSALKVLSPARADLTHSLAPVVKGITTAPLSTNPAAAVLSLFTVLAYVLTFFMMRDLAWRWKESPWVVVIPLLIIAGLEAVIGIEQYFTSEIPQAFGTYTNHDNFAGLIEMTLPIAVMCGVAVMRRGRKAGDSPVVPIVLACCSWALAGVLLMAVACSLSRAGFLDSICVLLVIAGLSVGFHLPSKSARLLGVGVALAVVLVLMFSIPSERLIERVAMTQKGDLNSTTDRFYMWQETIPLIKQFPMFGVGLGGYESNFEKFQAIALGYRIEFAHNDYLNFFAELGVVGFAILAAIVYGVFQRVFAGMSHRVDESRRFLIVACAGSLIAIALHSIVDFNMQMPANAMMLAWIAGVGSFNGVD
jgi:O-antigen ligase